LTLMEILLYLQEILELTNFRRNKIGISDSVNSATSNPLK
jgi:hypothetical protein